MKKFLMMAFAAGALVAQTAPTPAVKAKKTVKPAAPLSIPANAVDQGDGSFRYVDPQGTAWLYRKTPFGVSRSPEATVLAHSAGQTPFGPSKSQTAAVAAVAPPVAKPGSPDDPDAKVTAVAKGENIEFTRPTPFGTTKWTKNKNDLTSGEKKIWSRLQPKGNQQ